MRFTYRTPGFTLIEIMIVVTMIAILAITVRPSVSKYLERGRDAGKIVDMSEIGKALRVYEIDKGSYPVGSIEGCYPQDTLVPNYLQKARVSPSGSKWDEGCGKNGLYGYGSSTYLMLLMANMENKNGGNYSGSTIGFTGSLSPLGYYTALVGTKRGTGSVYLSVDAGGGSTSSGGVTYSASSVSPSGPPPASTPTAGSCGGAAGQLTANPPTINLCSTGVPSTIVSGTGTYTWSCFGTDGGTNASCSAPRGYNVNFDGNGGSGHSPTSKVVAYGATIATFPNPVPTRVDAYTHSGWYTQATGGTQILTSQVITSDVTYFSQWLPPVPSFKVTFRSVSGLQNIAFQATGVGTLKVDWGDGTTENISGSWTIHSYPTYGDYQIKISGDLRSFRTNNGYDYANNQYNIVRVDDWGGMKWDNMDYMFWYAENLVDIPSTPPDLTNITRLVGTFGGAKNFNDADIASWNVGNIVDMSTTFRYASKFNQPLNSWNVGNVTNMSSMFYGASLFNQPLGSWDVSKVTNMNAMFALATAFNQPLNSWNVGNVVNMGGMFAISGFNQPLNLWNTSKVTNMNGMFSSTNAFNQPIEGWDVSKVTDMNGMFQNALAFNQPIEGWDVGSVLNMSTMFAGTGTIFNQPIEGWDVSKVANMSGMFSQNTAFNQPIEGWDVSSVNSMSSMFSQNTAFNQPLGGWGSKTSNVTNMGLMFYNNPIFNQPLNSWNVGNVASMQSMFERNTTFNQPLGGWDVSKVTNMSNMFRFSNYNNSSIGSWVPSSVTTMYQMFNYNQSFNQPINSWNVGNVTNMYSMFDGTILFNQPLNLWNTSKVTEMRTMFYGANSFNQNISNWPVNSVSSCTLFKYNTPLIPAQVPNFTLCNPY